MRTYNKTFYIHNRRRVASHILEMTCATRYNIVRGTSVTVTVQVLVKLQGRHSTENIKVLNTGIIGETCSFDYV